MKSACQQECSDRWAGHVGRIMSWVIAERGAPVWRSDEPAHSGCLPHKRSVQDWDVLVAGSCYTQTAPVWLDSRQLVVVPWLSLPAHHNIHYIAMQHERNQSRTLEGKAVAPLILQALGSTAQSTADPDSEIHAHRGQCWGEGVWREVTALGTLVPDYEFLPSLS